jgi:hypothetical protein
MELVLCEMACRVHLSDRCSVFAKLDHMIPT